MANRGCGCKSPTNTRLNENGYFEQSFDGGLTWERVTGDDRFNGPIFPPLVGPVVGTVACAGAKSNTEVFRLEIEAFKANTSAWESVVGLITLLVGFLAALIPGIGPIIAGIATAFIWIIFQFTQAAFQSHDFEPALADYLCILFCNISDDASFTEAQWQQVKADIVDQMTGIDETWFWNHVNALGTVGLTNASRIFASLAGDCSQCDCGACTEPTLSTPGIGENLIPRPDLGAGWWQVTTTGIPNPASADCYAEVDFSCCLHTAYILSPGLTNAAPGNRVAYDCDDVISGSANYGLGGCVGRVLFRSFEIGQFMFQIQECP